MPRRYRPEKRVIEPDLRYQSVTISLFVNRMMRGGKKSTARRIMYDSFEIIQDRTKRDPIEVFEQAVQNVTPRLEVKPRRVGGATYQVPMEIRPQRRMALTFRWLRDYSRKRGERTMRERLAAELMDAHNNTGSCVKKKEDTHRMAEANRAFAHFRF